MYFYVQCLMESLCWYHFPRACGLLRDATFWHPHCTSYNSQSHSQNHQSVHPRDVHLHQNPSPCATMLYQLIPRVCTSSSDGLHALHALHAISAQSFRRRATKNAIQKQRAPSKSALLQCKALEQRDFTLLRCK